MSRIVRFLLFLVLVAVFTPAENGSAAGQPQCGAMIKQDTKLTADVGPNCTGDGLIIAGSNLTLDLNGHTIDGSSAISNPGSGIGMLGNQKAVTVKNGTILQFGTGVTVGGSRINLRDLRITENSLGINWGALGGAVRRVRTYANVGDGLDISASIPSTLFSNDTFIGNSGTGAHLAHPATFVGSFFTGNALSGATLDFGAGGSVFRSNYFNDNGSQGLNFGSAPDVTVASNIANYNSQWGIDGSPPVIDGGGNLAKANGQTAQCLYVSCN